MGGAWGNPRYKPVDPERAILGKIGSDYYGIPRIMDILEENDLFGTFFVEVFAGLNGYRSELAEAYSQIVGRGHDVQLHLHPIHYYYYAIQQGLLDTNQLPPFKDMIGTLPQPIQSQMLQKGILMFREMIGRTPVAFRAGNFGASMTTLKVLEELGIRFDSSFSAAYLQAGCMLDSGRAINSPYREGELWEVPITTVAAGTWGMCRLKPLNINALSLLEMIKVLREADSTGLSTLNFIAHSFSLFKAADIQFRKLRPDRLVLRRFQGLCRFLRKYPDRFRVVVFSDIVPSSLEGRETVMPSTGTILPILRKLVQGVNRIPWV